MAMMGNMLPIIAVRIEMWTKGHVTTSATTISTTAPTRSNQGARLKNNHHTRIANEQTSAPSAA
jgi:hypothetical protein